MTKEPTKERTNPAPRPSPPNPRSPSAISPLSPPLPLCLPTAAEPADGHDTLCLLHHHLTSPDTDARGPDHDAETPASKPYAHTGGVQRHLQTTRPHQSLTSHIHTRRHDHSR
ncbi:hypothetical protein M3J09_011573 [Ascochyta lentis]